MRLYKILKKPIFTEKASSMELLKSGYVFQVAPDATKIDVKKAISEIY
jgi:ribosomal protein L23